LQQLLDLGRFIVFWRDQHRSQLNLFVFDRGFLAGFINIVNIALDTLAAPTDVTTLNASTTAHGLMPKAPNDVSQYFRGDATWAISPGSTATTSTFTCPAFYAAVAGVLIASSPWLQPGDKVFVAGAGKFFVSAKASNTSVTLFNTGDLGNASSGTIASGSEILLVPKEIGESLFSSWTDDFLIPNLGGWYLTGSAGTGAAIFDTTAFTDANHPGCATLVSASTATGYAWMTSSPGYFNINTAGDTIAFRAVIDCAVKPTTVAAANGVFYVGLGTQLSAATQPVDFIGFSFIPATDTTNWRFTTVKSGTGTNSVQTSYAFAINTWVDMSFICVAGTAFWRIYTWNGTFPAKSAGVSTDIPTNSVGFVNAIYNGASGTTQFTNYLDLLEIHSITPALTPRFRGANLVNNF
jgi:hypothetical protein